MGGKSSSPPDFTALAASTDRAAATAERLGNRQLDQAEIEYADQKIVTDKVVDAALSSMEQQNAQAKDYYDYQKETFRPVEQGLVADAENFSSEGYRQAQAQEASAASARAFSTQSAMRRRANAARGVNPNSGAARGADRGLTLAQTAMSAKGMTDARRNAEQMGFARRLDVTGLGRGLAGASTAAYNGGTNAGNSGVNAAGAAGNNFQSALGSAGNTFQSGYRNQISGQSSILNNQTSAYNASNNNTAELFGTIAGAGIGLIPSDERMKEHIARVGTDPGTGLALYIFSYIGEAARYIGVMAAEVKARFPEAVGVMENGYDGVRYDLLGIQMTRVA